MKDLGRNSPGRKASTNESQGIGVLTTFGCLVFLYYNQDFVSIGLTASHWF